MKFNKLTKTAIVFTIGASVFVTTAFADMMLGSGYDKLKQSIKTTVSMLEKDFSSYSVVTNAELKLDGELLHHTYDLEKVDNVNKRKSSHAVVTNFIDPTKTYSSERYSDTEYYLYKNEDGEFYGERFMNPNEAFVTSDYNEVLGGEYAVEFEKVVDAAVGSLKNLVQYDSNPDGTFKFNGEVTASQVPALYNAIISLLAKEGFAYELGTNKIDKATDIYVSSIFGSATQHANGYLTQIEGGLELTFKNTDNVQQVLEVLVDLEIQNVNSTVIERPVVNEDQLRKVYDDQGGLNPRYIGTYKNNIIIFNENEMTKIGERIVTITGVEDGQMKGSYEQIITVPSEDLKSMKLEFINTTHKLASNLIEYRDVETGETGLATLNEGYLDSIYFDINIMINEEGYLDYPDEENGEIYYNSDFRRVFE